MFIDYMSLNPHDPHYLEVMPAAQCFNSHEDNEVSKVDSANVDAIVSEAKAFAAVVLRNPGDLKLKPGAAVCNANGVGFVVI